MYIKVLPDFNSSACIAFYSLASCAGGCLKYFDHVYVVFAQAEQLSSLYLSSLHAWTDAGPTGEADALQDVCSISCSHSLLLRLGAMHDAFGGPFSCSALAYAS